MTRLSNVGASLSGRRAPLVGVPQLKHDNSRAPFVAVVVVVMSGGGGVSRVSCLHNAYYTIHTTCAITVHKETRVLGIGCLKLILVFSLSTTWVV